MKNYAKRNACILNRHRYNNRRNVMIQCSRSICCPDCKNLKAKWWIKLNYTEAVEYILNVPKFTTKNKPEHTVVKKTGTSRVRHEGDPCCRNQWKRFCLCLSFRDADTGRQKDRPFYLSASGSDQRTFPDQQCTDQRRAFSGILSESTGSH